MKIHELTTALKKSGPSPLYLLLGEEEELREQALAGLKTAVGQEEGLNEFNSEVLYGDESNASEILTRATEAPVFSPRRLIIVKMAEKLSARDGELLLSYLKSPCDSTTLVFVAAKLDGRTKFSQELKARAAVVDCTPLPEAQLAPWLRTEIGRLGIRIEDAAVLLLRDLAGSNSLSFMKRELEKLSAYVPKGRVATLGDLEALRGGEVGASVFDLTSAIASVDRLRVLRIFTRNLEAGEAPLRILGSLVWQYRQVWKAKESLQNGRGESEAARLLRVPPFKVRDFIGRFSDAHLHMAFRLFAETDNKLKGAGATAPARVLDALGLELCRLADRPRTKSSATTAARPRIEKMSVVGRGPAGRTVKPSEPTRR